MLVALAIVAAAVARPTSSAAATASCSKGVSIGMLAPITGPAGSIGSDQLHWAQFYFAQWNKVKGHVKIKLAQGDTQLDPSKASTVAQSFASNGSIMAVIGPAGSDEVQAVAPILKKAGLAFTSGSATRVSLSDGKYKGYFFRVVPNDGVQGPTAAGYMGSTLGVKSGDSVMLVDDQESYSTGLADIVGTSLTGKGVKVDRESVSQKATDFSSLVAKVTATTKVVYVPFQARLAGPALRAAAQGAGQDGGRVRQRRHVRLVEVQRRRELHLVLRSGRHDAGECRVDRRFVPQAVPGCDEPVRCSELCRCSGVCHGDHDGVQGQEDLARRGQERVLQGQPEEHGPGLRPQVHHQR